MLSDDADDVLTAKVAAITVGEAVSVMRSTFGLEGEVTLLTGERDQNFKVEIDGKPAYVLKVTHPHEARTVTNFQTAALNHMARHDPGLPVPKLLPALDGQQEVALPFADGSHRVVRLLQFLPGMPSHTVTASVRQRRNLATALAQVGRALRDFDHAAADHELLWDIKHADRLRHLLEHIESADGRALAAAALDDFQARVLPRMASLRAQVIHNDLNAHNVLVGRGDPDVITGIIDFGDMVRAPLINDVAVACAYQLDDPVQPLRYVAEFVDAYRAVTPLHEIELELLYDLIRTRLAATVLITGWRARQHPANRAYILRNNPLSWHGLRALDAIGRPAAQDALMRYAAPVGTSTRTEKP